MDCTPKTIPRGIEKFDALCHLVSSESEFTYLLDVCVLYDFEGYGKSKNATYEQQISTLNRKINRLRQEKVQQLVKLPNVRFAQSSREEYEHGICKLEERVKLGSDNHTIKELLHELGQERRIIMQYLEPCVKASTEALDSIRLYLSEQRRSKKISDNDQRFFAAGLTLAQHTPTRIVSADKDIDHMFRIYEEQTKLQLAFLTEEKPYLSVMTQRADN